MKQATASVKGKILLSGEHAVVYGYPALVAGINLGIEVTIQQSSRFSITSLHRDGMGLVLESLKVLGFAPTSIDVKIASTLPVGSGMGSSAALCAAVIKAGSVYMGKSLSEEEWFQLTWEAEKKAHGNSSGVDPAAVVYGGLLWYVRGQEMERVRASRGYHLLVVQTGRPRESTGQMVEVVAQSYALHAARYKRLFGKIGSITMQMRGAMIEGEEVKDFVDENGKLLESLGVVSEKACQLSKQLRDMGCGVKIAGAGGIVSGSGIMIVVHDNLDTIQQWLVDNGYQTFRVTIGEL